MLSQTECTKLVHSAEVEPIVSKLKGAATTLECLELPALDKLLAASAAPVPYKLDFEQVRREPILILHSSGSTGIPKPVIMTHGSFAVVDNDRNIPTVTGRRNHDLTTWDLEPGSKLYVPFPPFHLAGFFNSIMLPVFTETVPIFGPPLRLPSGSLTAEILRKQEVRGCFLPPTTTAELYHEPDGPELLKKLSILCYAGGPLNEAIGNELVSHVSLCQFYGSTEVGQVRQLLPTKEHWQYMEFHPNSSQEMQLADDNSYELVIYADDSTENISALNHNFPGLREYRTKDLFKQHPSKPGLWKFHARRDDIIVLSSGEKLNPIPLEMGLAAVPGVAGALLVGQGQPRVALLVELSSDDTLKAEPVESLWPFVSRLNESIPSYGHVSKSMILIADTTKPFIRAGKGTVIRKLTAAAYENELSALFEGRIRSKAKTRVLNPAAVRLDDIKTLVRVIIQFVLGGKAISDDESVYVQGLDSVKSLEVLDEVRASLASHSRRDLTWLSQQVLYTHSTINDLSKVLLEWLNTGSTPQRADRILRIKETLSAHEASLPVASSFAGSNERRQKCSVVLVGSTGYVGQYLLTTLFQDPKISQIYCLNRSASAHQQWKSHASRHSIDMVAKKITFHQIDLTKMAYGLDQSAYDELKDNCDVIIHSAWQVNFVLPLPVFTDSFDGLLNSIRLAASTANQSRLLFISSISATGVFGKPGEPRQTIPEATVDDLDASMGTGYGDSKLIAEHLIRAATAKSGIRASILRLGQVAPSSESGEATWPLMDSVKALLLTSKALQLVPTDVLDVDWLPVHTIVYIIQDIMHHDCAMMDPTDLSVYNLVNSSQAQWSHFVPSIQEWCGERAVTTTLNDWLSSMKKQAIKQGIKQGSQQLPGLQLIPFYDLLLERGESHQYHQERLLQASSHALNLRAIDKATFEGWLAAL